MLSEFTGLVADGCDRPVSHGPAESAGSLSFVVVRALNYRLKLGLNLKHRPVDRFLHAKQSEMRELEERDRVPLWTKTGVESEVAHDFRNAKQPERA
jgi:hypothetical protein